MLQIRNLRKSFGDLQVLKSIDLDVNKGDVVWTVNIQDLAIIGRLFNEGRVDMTKIIAVAGSEIEKPQYCRVRPASPTPRPTPCAAARDLSFKATTCLPIRPRCKT